MSQLAGQRVARAYRETSDRDTLLGEALEGPSDHHPAQCDNVLLLRVFSFRARARAHTYSASHALCTCRNAHIVMRHVRANASS